MDRLFKLGEYNIVVKVFNNPLRALLIFNPMSRTGDKGTWWRNPEHENRRKAPTVHTWISKLLSIQNLKLKFKYLQIILCGVRMTCFNTWPDLCKRFSTWASSPSPFLLRKLHIFLVLHWAWVSVPKMCIHHKMVPIWKRIAQRLDPHLFCSILFHPPDRQ